MVYQSKATPAEIAGLLKMFEILSPIFQEDNEGYRRCFMRRISRITEAMIVFFGIFPNYSDFRGGCEDVLFVELIGFSNIEFFDEVRFAR